MITNPDRSESSTTWDSSIGEAWVQNERGKQHETRNNLENKLPSLFDPLIVVLIELLLQAGLKKNICLAFQAIPFIFSNSVFRDQLFQQQTALIPNLVDNFHCSEYFNEKTGPCFLACAGLNIHVTARSISPVCLLAVILRARIWRRLVAKQFDRGCLITI